MSSSASGAFERLDERVQRWIWKQGWTELRDIQEMAIREILDGGSDVVIASATASGKTEAAFLPIGSALVAEEAAGPGVRVLYISPLKALINDQHGRLEAYFEELNIPVHRWHGDVASSIKQRVMKGPAGVLLITPESLEALFVRQGSRVPGLFADLRFIVVDELHAFIGSERGRQLESLMHRVELAARQRIPRIALSATLGDMDLACDFLRAGGGGDVRQVISTGSRQEVQLQLRGYRLRPSRGGDDPGSGALMDIGRDLFERLRGGRHIVFANARRDVESYTDLLRRLCDKKGVQNEFWAHHGSLSKELREDAEDALRSAERPATVLATMTLELGIDVGAVESIAQIGPPSSVASMRQRLGRSGRRGSPAVLRMYVQEEEVTDSTLPQDQLRSGLVQSIAMVRLLAQRWYEPPNKGALHLSTLVQQVLSLVAQHGGVRANKAWSALCESGPFKGIDAPMFGQFLRGMASHELVTQTHDGEIVLDLKGERIVNHYDFYSAFTSPEEFRLITGSRTLGTLPVTHPLVEDMHIIFGGRRWKVISVDLEQKVVNLAPAGGGNAPKFSGSAALIHNRVREEMRAVYLAEDRPMFVDHIAFDLLAEARATFRRFNLGNRSILPWGRSTLIFPWAGDRVMNTMLLQLVARGVRVHRDGISLTLHDTTADGARAHLEALTSVPPADPVELAAEVQNKATEKHHRFLSDKLLAADYASNHLDSLGAHRAMKSCLE
jgi:ATP-dependent Lhr-like helicase